MDTLTASERLSALGHETRLSIFRLLVETGPAGVAAGAIQQQLGLPPATTSFHIAHLARVGLVHGRQDGRFIFYSADFAAMDQLIAFLTDNCCAGGSCLPRTARASSTALRRAQDKVK